MPKLSLAILCGGPSRERGISLNSARSVCDHLSDTGIEFTIIYFDPFIKPHLISRESLYSNTPSDFDFKLDKVGKELNQDLLIKTLSEVDIVFPVIHGIFGEDGQLQTILEEAGCPFIGSPALACFKAFDKFEAYRHLKGTPFYTLPTLLLQHGQDNHHIALNSFFKEHALTSAVVKPARGGSSIGVHLVHNVPEALDAVSNIFDNEIDNRIVVEPFCKGREFTVIILEDDQGAPVSLIPTQINLNTDISDIYDYRKKYLATKQVTFTCPPAFPDEIITAISQQAEELYRFFGFRDFARFDGWLLSNGDIYFADFNPISGMEQNSFLFIQSSQIGMSHRDVLIHILENACKRYGLAWQASSVNSTNSERKPVQVIFGGSSAERHVSLMSGTNVWLKLRQSAEYEPRPFLLDSTQHVWSLPYSFALYHTTEEIEEICLEASVREKRLAQYRAAIFNKLKLNNERASETEFLPQRMSLAEFIAKANCVFIALHGGIGENGKLQAMLEEALVSYTGSGADASAICMNKKHTADKLESLEEWGIFSTKKFVIPPKEIVETNITSFWQELYQHLELSPTNSCIIKPIGDGCSAGVARLANANDLAQYLEFTLSGASRIPAGKLSMESRVIELPPTQPEELLFEPFIETDEVRVNNRELIWRNKTGWIEITMGVIGPHSNLTAMNPSLTVAESNVLSLEEKFQGGTGINITPPPEPFVSQHVIQAARDRMKRVAETLGINGFARIDAFMKVETGELLIIEANTVPGLTPSTVIYHQALAETPPMIPREFLERILDYRNTLSS